MKYARFEHITSAWPAVACALLLGAAAAAQQGGDTCATAPDISGPLPITVSGTTVGYNNDYDAVCPYAGSTAPDVVYKFTPGSDILVDLLLCTGLTDFDTKLYVYDSCPPPVGAPLACNDDACTSAAGHGYVSALYNVPTQAGRTYYIVIDGYDGDAGNYTLTMSPSFAVPGCPADGAVLLSSPLQKSLDRLS